MPIRVREFADWVRSKPRDERYTYTDPSNCAVAQFLKEKGMATNPRVGSDDWYDYDDRRNKGLIPAVLQRYVRDEDHPATTVTLLNARTFGRLADRLEALGDVAG